MSASTPATPRSTAAAQRGLSIALLGMLALHVWPIAGDPAWVLWGWVPWDLAYALLWMLGAAALVLFMTGPAWPDEPTPEPQPPLSPEGGEPS